MIPRLRVEGWTEHAGLASTLTQLTPYLTSEGYWVFLSRVHAPPAGAVAGGFVLNGSDNTLVPGVSGRRLRRSTGGQVFFR